MSSVDLDQELDELRGEMRDNLVCSGAWLDTILPIDEDGHVSDYHPDLYPPGLDETQMRNCQACGRVAPANGTAGICCDCETEEDEIAFAACLEIQPGDYEPLAKVRWNRPVCFAVTPLESGPEPAQPPEFFLAPEKLFHAQGPPESLEDAADREQRSDEEVDDEIPKKNPAANQQAIDITCRVLGIPSLYIRFVDRIPRSSLNRLPAKVADELNRTLDLFTDQIATSVRAVMRAIRRACAPLSNFVVYRWRGNIMLFLAGQRLCLLRYAPDRPTRNVSVGSGRAAGCALTLLPEDEGTLRCEIDYARTHAQVRPSSQRFSQPNPYQKAPEDGQGVRVFFRRRHA